MTGLKNYRSVAYVTTWITLTIRGHPFMTSTKISGFWPPPLVHMRPHDQDPHTPLWTSTYGRHEIHIALLKRLVQWPSGPITEIRLYDCNLFKTVLVVIYITNLYRRKVSTFYSAERRNSGKRTPTSLHEKKTAWHQWTLFLIFVWTSPRPHASTWAWLHSNLCVDVINGWPLICLQIYFV